MTFENVAALKIDFVVFMSCDAVKWVDVCFRIICPTNRGGRLFRNFCKYLPCDSVALRRGRTEFIRLLGNYAGKVGFEPTFWDYQ